MSNWDHVKGYEEQLKSGDVIASIWCIEDVQSAGEEIGLSLTDEEARDILSVVDRRHDAEIGINWIVIQTHIEMSDIDYPPVEDCPECGEFPSQCDC